MMTVTPPTDAISGGIWYLVATWAVVIMVMVFVAVFCTITFEMGPTGFRIMFLVRRLSRDQRRQLADRLQALLEETKRR